MIYSLVSTFLSVFCVARTQVHAPIVSTSLGPVQGIVDENKDGVFLKYMGIPYARVRPLNHFGDPIKPTPWSEVLKADSDDISCPQRSDNGTYIGTTDCLVLNVYSPAYPNPGEKLPVIVYTHGGSFVKGNCGSDTYGPEKLVRHGVILVTHNYRLGPYGYMCFGNDEVPGNAGLKDVVFAYRWVKENIEAFGGNSSDITAMGESVGGSVVDILMLSPMSQGLFQKAILQSGTFLNFRFDTDFGLNTWNALLLAYSLGYRGPGLDGVITFLSKQNPHNVVEEAEKFNFFAWPCLELLNTKDNEIFISENPIKIYIANEYPKIPMILGITNKEAMPIIEKIVRNDFNDSLEPIRDSHFEFMLQYFHFDNASDKEAIANLVRKFYFGDNELNKDGIIDLYTDILFGVNQETSLSMYVEKSQQPIYYYIFSYDGDRNYVKHLENLTLPGAAHADELAYLFLQPIFNGSLTENDSIVMDRMTTMWTNFAKYGDPTPELNDLLPVKWEAAKVNERNYLNIDLKLTTGKRAFHERMAFWDLIRKNHGKDGCYLEVTSTRITAYKKDVAIDGVRYEKHKL